LRIWFLLNLFNLSIWILIVRCSFITKHRDLFIFYDLRDRELRCRSRFVYLSFLCRLQIVMWISWDEILRESFNRIFVWDLLLISQFVRWESEHDRIRMIEKLLKLSSKLVWLRATMRWLDVTYSYWERERNMISFLKDYCFNN
jgi:hypothetical protein